jgi:hypothetical protein
MLGGIFTKAGFSNFNSQTIDVPTFQGADAQEYWEATSEVAGPLLALLSKMPPEKKKAISDEVIQTVHGMFPAGPVRLGGEAIVGTGTRL